MELARELTWGAILPHGAAGEYDGDGWTGASAWGRLRDCAQECDDLGYDHLWMSDHLMGSTGERTGIYFESYTALAALAGLTHRARLGAMVTCAQYRSVAMLAKQAANVDVISQGRLILALGGGWDEGEFAAYGLPFPPPAERVAVFDETLEAILALWSTEKVDYDGNYVKLSGASCTPRPEGRPPIWTGTHGVRGLRTAARHADVANWNVSLAEFIRLSGVLDEACNEVGRDRSTIDTSVFRLADLSGSLSVIEGLLAEQGAPIELAASVAADHFIGSPEDVVPRVQAFVDAGARHIVMLFLDAATTNASAEKFQREVIPNVSLKQVTT
jgi:alkanesulfonate monooxygenase SsuD/methylene tetrahydromethanopterin reductase-like flavin-dependent oxidoreductase (luciferase family)